jgi:hypothetical protein
VLGHGLDEHLVGQHFAVYQGAIAIENYGFHVAAARLERPPLADESSRRSVAYLLMEQFSPGVRRGARGARAVCPNRHAFDRARSGYWNLLLSNKKQSAEPGDSVAMLQSRRAFLQGGFYDPMADAATTAVADILAGRGEGHLADLGCGEGFFTARLRRSLAGAMPGPVCYGVDISRPGEDGHVTDRGSTGPWRPARSPFLPHSLDVARHVADRWLMSIASRQVGALVTVTLTGSSRRCAPPYKSVQPHRPRRR